MDYFSAAMSLVLASDGILSVDELAQHALRHGLDFLAITHHNQMVSAASLTRLGDDFVSRWYC